MSKTQKVIQFIAKGAKEVGDLAFEAALTGLVENLNSVPEELHFYVLEQMWGEKA